MKVLKFGKYPLRDFDFGFLCIFTWDVHPEPVCSPILLIYLQRQKHCVSNKVFEFVTMNDDHVQ
jgi:hypothetical protein